MFPSYVKQMFFLAVLWVAVLPVADANAYMTRAVRVVLLGDSTASGYGLLSPEESLASRLKIYSSASSNIDMVMVTMADENDTTSSVLARLPDVLAQRPDIVVMALGENDGRQRLDPDIMYNNLEVMLKEFERAGTYILLCGMKAPVDTDYEYASQYNRVFPKLAERHNVNFYPALTDGIVGNRINFQRDGIHPSKEGADYIAKHMASLLHEMLVKLQDSRGN